MTEHARTKVLVWDASAVHHALKADRADVLIHLGNGLTPAGSRHVTTDFVARELSSYELLIPAGMEVVTLTSIDELVALAEWTDRVSTSNHSRGEATVCAWAQVNDGLVVIDDGPARRVARKAGLEVLGTLGLIADAINRGDESHLSANSLVDTLIAHGARYPFSAGGFTTWAAREGLLVGNRSTSRR